MNDNSIATNEIVKNNIPAGHECALIREGFNPLHTPLKLANDVSDSVQTNDEFRNDLESGKSAYVPPIDYTKANTHEKSGRSNGAIKPVHTLHKSSTSSNTSGISDNSLKIPEKTRIRQWVLNLIPDVDAPALNVFAKSLEKDGVNNLGDLQECLSVGVLELSDIKAYINLAGIQKLKAVKILKAIHQMTANT
jgi:hypothetical protein